MVVKVEVNKMQKMMKWMEHNRYVLIFPVVGVMLWAYALGCTPTTMSPLFPGRMVNITQLDIDFKTWQSQQGVMAAKFEAAGLDLEQQKAGNEKIGEMIMDLAAGGIPDASGLIKLLIGGGGLGAILDNIRKGGVIGGLKRNKEPA